MNRLTFAHLVDDLTPLISKNEVYAINSSGTPISVKTRLAVTLRWLAGGQQIDLCFAWGIAKSTFYSIRGVLWPTIEALNILLHLGFPINDSDALEELSRGFSMHSGGIMKGAVLAIDGLAVKVRCPKKWECRHRKDYRNRKGGFAIVILAGCDINGRFYFATAKHTGSTNDIIAWEESKLKEAVEDLRQLPEQYFFIGDEAFSNTQQFLSPWPGRGLGPFKDSFNFWLSHSRQSIERAFGMLTQRWGIFWRRFSFSLDRWALVSQVCMKLHNLCMDRAVPMPDQRFHEDHVRGDQWQVNDNIQDDDAILRRFPTGDRRRNMTDELERLGIVRPAHAEPNSRAR